MYRIVARNDIQHLRSQYQKNGLIQLHNFLNPASVSDAENAISTHTAWMLSGVDADRRPISEPESMEKLINQEISTIGSSAYQAAAYEFRYRFRSFSLITDPHKVPNSLREIRAFFMSNTFKLFIENLTLEKYSGNIDGHLAKYCPGDFLATHTDAVSPTDSRRRETAFVFYLTKKWRYDWGGLTSFWNTDGSGLTLNPSYNTLLVFKVPTEHSVSLITPFAPNSRFSVAGWFHKTI